MVPVVDNGCSKTPSRLMPVPMMGIVAKWTKNTTNPMRSGAKIYNYITIN